MKIDDVIADMAAHKVNRRMLVGGGAAAWQGPLGAVTEATVKSDELESLISPLTPVEFHDMLESTGRTCFVHKSPHGKYDIFVIRDADSLQVNIVAVSSIATRLTGLCVMVGGVAVAWGTINWAHETGAFFIATAIVAPFAIAMGLSSVLTGEGPPIGVGFDDMKLATKICLVLSLVGAIGFVALLHFGLL